MMAGLRTNIGICELNRARRKKNPTNDTYVSSIFDLDTVKVGRGMYGPLNVLSSPNESSLNVGRYCGIARVVRFVINNEHHLDALSTFPFFTVHEGAHRARSKGRTTIGDDVCFGARATIIDGVTMGQGAVTDAELLPQKTWHLTRSKEPYNLVQKFVEAAADGS